MLIRDHHPKDNALVAGDREQPQKPQLQIILLLLQRQTPLLELLVPPPALHLHLSVVPLVDVEGAEGAQDAGNVVGEH